MTEITPKSDWCLYPKYLNHAEPYPPTVAHVSQPPYCENLEVVPNATSSEWSRGLDTLATGYAVTGQDIRHIEVREESEVRPPSLIPSEDARHERKSVASVFSGLLGRLLNKLAFVVPGGASLRPWLHRLRGARIGTNVWIAQLVYLDELHPGDIEIGDNCTIGYRSSIFTHFYWGRRRSKSGGKVIIERDVFIGPHCVILPNVKIGEGAVIRAGTVVSRNVPAHAVWGSPPAELLGVATVPLTPDHSYEEFTSGMQPASRLRPGPKTGGRRV